MTEIMPWRFPDKPISTTPDCVAALRENEWLAQAKYDGWNVSCYTDKVRFPHLFSSSGRKLCEVTNVPTFLTEQFVEVSRQLPPMSAFNAEFVGPRGNYQPRFYIFDCLAWDGEWQSLEPFKNRWKIVTGEVGARATAGIQLAETVDTDFMELFNRLKSAWYDDGCKKLSLCEGIVLKRLSGDLNLNRNSSGKNRHMFKIKFRDILEKLF